MWASLHACKCSVDKFCLWIQLTQCAANHLLPLQKDKAVNVKKEDKKTKMKAKESSESAANEENHSENGDAKVSAVL